MAALAVAVDAVVDLRALLRLRPFRHYLTGQTLSAFGDSLIPIALVFAVIGQGGDATGVGLVLLASRVPSIVIVLLGGVIGDRLDRRRVMLLTDTARCVLQAGTSALLLTGHASLWVLAALQALSGTASALFGPAAAGLVRALVPAAALTWGNALLGLGRSVVAVGGLAVAGMIVATVGPGWAFAVDAGTFTASAVFLALLPGLPPPDPADRSVLLAALAGVREVVGRRWLWTSIGYVACLNLVAVCPFLVLGPMIARTDLGGLRAWTAIALGYAGGGICGSALALRWQPRHPLRVAFTVARALSPLLLLLGAAAPVPVLAASAVLAGGQASVFNTFHGTTLQTHVPVHLVSRIASVNLLGTLATVPIGLSPAGPLAQATSSRAVLTAGGLLAVLGTLAVLAAPDVRGLTRQPRPEGRTPAPRSP
jgi:MFS family permease